MFCLGMNTCPDHKHIGLAPCPVCYAEPKVFIDGQRGDTTWVYVKIAGVSNGWVRMLLADIRTPEEHARITLAQ